EKGLGILRYNTTRPCDKWKRCDDIDNEYPEITLYWSRYQNTLSAFSAGAKNNQKSYYQKQQQIKPHHPENRESFRYLEKITQDKKYINLVRHLYFPIMSNLTSSAALGHSSDNSFFKDMISRLSESKRCIISSRPRPIPVVVFST